MVQPTPSLVRVRLQVLCNFHNPVLRAGDERLRAAMAEYAQSVVSARERDNAFCGSANLAGR